MENSLHEKFKEAIISQNVPLARTLATLFDPSAPQIRLSAYRQVMLLALSLGRAMDAQEVAPFCGHRLKVEEYRQCMSVAEQKGDQANVEWCKRYII